MIKRIKAKNVGQRNFEPEKVFREGGGMTDSMSTSLAGCSVVPMPISNDKHAPYFDGERFQDFLDLLEQHVETKLGLLMTNFWGIYLGIAQKKDQICNRTCTSTAGERLDISKVANNRVIWVK